MDTAVPMGDVARLSSTMEGVLEHAALGSRRSRAITSIQLARAAVEAGWVPAAAAPAAKPEPVPQLTAAGWRVEALESLAAARRNVDGPDRVAYLVGAAQVHAMLAVAAAIREADSSSALARISDALNELRTTV